MNLKSAGVFIFENFQYLAPGGGVFIVASFVMRLLSMKFGESFFAC